VTRSLTGTFRRVDAKVIGVERLADLAFLKIEAHQLPNAAVQREPFATRLVPVVYLVGSSVA
jgi:hypothetical protein